MSDYRWPVAEPDVVDSYVRELADKAASEGEKAKAFDTPFRCSSVHSCGRKQVYSALGLEPDTKTDRASLVVMDLGTVVHELVQDAVGRRYPDAQFECQVTVSGLVSGHCDIWLPSRSEVVELKTVGRYAYEEAMGVTHPRPGRQSARETPFGPKLGHITQAAMYAWGLGAETVRIGYICKEAFSPGIQERMGLSVLDRVMAEWVIPKAVWAPLAKAELLRLADLKAYVDGGFIPERIAVDDHGHQTQIDPEAEQRRALYRESWMCRGFCGYRDRCIADGPAAAPVELRKKELV